MMEMNNIIHLLREKQKFLLTTHVNPDPDGLCAELALMLFLKSLGKKVCVVNDDEVPMRYHFLPKIKQIKAYKDKMRLSYDSVIVLDCGDLNRIGKVKALLSKEAPLVNIDHHITNELFGELNAVDPKASSTTEVLYEFLSKAKCTMTKEIATCLYVGLMTDTGSFRYENTTSRTHKIAGALLEYGISVSQIYKKLYDTIPLNDLRMFARIMADFETHCRGRVVTLDLHKKDLSKLSRDFDVRDAIFKFLRSTKDIGIFIIFTEFEKNKTRVNFRSSGTFNVCKLAAHFGGGGHSKASGCIIKKSVKGSKQAVLKEVQRLLKEHKKK